jgi:hypothetical protein
MLNPTVTGNIQISNEKKISGELKIKIVDWQYLLTVLSKNSILDKSKINVLRNGFNMLSSQKKIGSQIEIPISIKNNSIFVGPLNFGNIQDILKDYIN